MRLSPSFCRWVFSLVLAPRVIGQFRNPVIRMIKEVVSAVIGGLLVWALTAYLSTPETSAVEVEYSWVDVPNPTYRLDINSDFDTLFSKLNEVVPLPETAG